MRPFEQFFEFGKENKDASKTLVKHMPASQLTLEEKKYLEEAIFNFMKYQENSPDLVTTYMCGFNAGIAYAGAYLYEKDGDDATV